MALIREPSHRLRESIDTERLGALADSLAAEGLHQPIGVRRLADGDGFEIVWGHRRFLAAQLLHWPAIEAKVHDADFDPLLAAVTENNNREDLTPMDDARALARFVERGEPLAAIARLMRRSPVWVSTRLELLSLPADLQDAIHDRELPLAVARALADVDHAPYRTKLIAEAKRAGATARTVEVWAAHYRAERELIVANGLMVEEIASRRDAWKIMIACELCHEDKEYPATRTLRACLECMAELGRMIDERAAAAVAAEATAAP